MTTTHTPGTALEPAAKAELQTRAQQAISQLEEQFAEQYPVLASEVPIGDLMEEAMGPGGTINLGNLTRIKVPASDVAKQWIVPDDNGDPTFRKELVGIPVGLMSRRSMWVSEEVSGSAPDCSSADLVTGTGLYGPGSEGNPSGLCATCPMAERGSAGRGTPASKCKEQRVIFLLNSDLLPLMVVVPSGSLPNFKNFGAFVFKKAIRGLPRPGGTRSSSWLRLEVGLGLEQDTNATGQEYNKVTFRIARRLTAAELEVVNSYGVFVDEMIAEQGGMLADLADGVGDTPPTDDVPFDIDGLADDVDITGGDGGDDAPADDEPATAGSGRAAKGR